MSQKIYAAVLIVILLVSLILGITTSNDPQEVHAQETYTQVA